MCKAPSESMSLILWDVERLGIASPKYFRSILRDNSNQYIGLLFDFCWRSLRFALTDT